MGIGWRKQGVPDKITPPNPFPFNSTPCANLAIPTFFNYKGCFRPLLFQVTGKNESLKKTPRPSLCSHIFVFCLFLRIYEASGILPPAPSL
jgi:hypothetical protein